jgi:hypothetical protein
MACRSAAFVLLLLSLLRQRCRTALLVLFLYADARDDCPRQQVEYLIDVGVVLGARLQELNAISFGEGESLLVRDLAVSLQVGLRRDEYHVDFCLARLLDLLDPGLDVVEADGIGDGVGEDDAVRPLVEGLGDVPEPLLPSSVPDVERYLVAI